MPLDYYKLLGVPKSVDNDQTQIILKALKPKNNFTYTEAMDEETRLRYIASRKYEKLTPEQRQKYSMIRLVSSKNLMPTTMTATTQQEIIDVTNLLAQFSGVISEWLKKSGGASTIMSVDAKNRIYVLESIEEFKQRNNIKNDNELSNILRSVTQPNKPVFFLFFSQQDVNNNEIQKTLGKMPSINMVNRSNIPKDSMLQQPLNIEQQGQQQLQLQLSQQSSPQMSPIVTPEQSPRKVMESNLDDIIKIKIALETIDNKFLGIKDSSKKEFDDTKALKNDVKKLEILQQELNKIVIPQTNPIEERQLQLLSDRISKFKQKVSNKISIIKESKKSKALEEEDIKPLAKPKQKTEAQVNKELNELRKNIVNINIQKETQGKGKSKKMVNKTKNELYSEVLDTLNKYTGQNYKLSSILPEWSEFTEKLILRQPNEIIPYIIQIIINKQ